jgi:hypothetical protein
MRTDGVILGKLRKVHDHTHLEWTCPDCGNACAVEGGYGSQRYVCSTTGREFVVMEVGASPGGIKKSKPARYSW